MKNIKDGSGLGSVGNILDGKPDSLLWHIRYFLLLTFGLFFGCQGAWAQDTWTNGHGNNNWTTSNNWNAGVPNSTTIAVIDLAGSDEAELKTTGTVGNLSVGNTSNGLLAISSTGALTISTELYLAANSTTSTGTITIDGANASLTLQSGNAAVGNLGTGLITITHGANLNATTTNDSGTFELGVFSNSTGTVNVGLDTTGNPAGSGTLEVDTLDVGYGGVGNLNINGANSSVTVQGGSANIGYEGTGTVAITNGATLDATTSNDAGTFELGFFAGSTGTVNVGLNASGTNDGPGTLNVDTLYVGGAGTGNLNISGANSSVTVQSGNVVVGNAGTSSNAAIGTVTITNGATLNATTSNDTGIFAIGAATDSTGTVNVGLDTKGSGTLNVDTLYVGESGTGSLNINGNNSSVTVQSGNVDVGYAGTGTVAITNGATLDATTSNDSGTFEIGVTSGSTGTMNVGLNASGTNDAPGTLDVDSLFVGGAGTGNLNINGANSSVTVQSGLVVVGNAGTSSNAAIGTVTITNGATLDAETTNDSGNFIIGSAADTTGTVNVKGGSTLNVDTLYVSESGVGNLNINGTNSVVNVQSGNVYVGYVGTGTVTITNGGTLDAETTNDSGVFIMGAATDATGTVNVNGGTLTEDGQLIVGEQGDGILMITNDGVVNNSDATIADGKNSTSSVTVEGAGSTWNNYGDLTVGEQGDATLMITNDGVVNNSDATIANGKNSTSSVTVEGAGSTWNNYGDLTVGAQGDATLTIEDKGVVNNNDATIANGKNSTSSVTVEGAGSIWNNYGDLTVGEQGNATLTIEDKGVVNNSAATIADGKNSTSSVTVENAGSTWNNYGNLTVGEQGNATLTIEDKGVVNNSAATIADGKNSTSSVTVEGAGSTWNNYGNLTVGEQGNATLTIEDKGVVNNSAATIAGSGGESSSVTVTGNASTWNNYGDLTVGNGGTGSLTIESNGTVNDTNGFVGEANHDNFVDVNNGTWSNQGSIYIGNAGKGSLTVENGGQVTAVDNSTIGNESGSKGDVDVTGNGSLLSIDGGANNLYVGGEGTGSLTVEDSGVVQADNLVIGELSGSTGTVKIGDKDTAGTLDVADVQFGAGNGNLIFDQTNNITFDTTIEDLGSGDSGTVIQSGSGHTVLGGDNDYTGTTLVTNGRLEVDSATALGDSDVTVNGGRLQIAPNAPITTLDVGGNYDQTGGTLRLALLSTTTNQTMIVDGTTTLGGAGTTLRIGLNGAPIAISNGVEYDLVQSTGLITGEFGTLSFNSNIILPTGGVELLTYTDHNVYLGFWQYLGSVYGLTPNQQAVANYIDQFVTKITVGNFDILVDNIYPLSTNPATLGSALDEISPQALQIFHQISFDNATFASGQLNNHLANLRDGLTGFDSSQLSFTDASLDPTLSQIKGRLLAWNPNTPSGSISDVVDPFVTAIDPKDMKDFHSSDLSTRWSTFIAGNVILADLDHNVDLAHQDYTTGSVTAGADYRIDDHFTVGALFGYSHTDATLDSIGSAANVDTYSPGIYASYVDGGWYGNGLFSYGYNSYSENRNISIGTLSGSNTGSSDGSQYVGDLTGGYEFKSGSWSFGPAAGVQYVNLGVGAINESGPTALNIDSQSAESFRTQFGLTARYATRINTCYGPMLFTPHLSALWQHECLDNGEGITSQFNQIGAGSFTVITSSPDRDSAFLDLGLDAQVAKEFTLFVDYQTEAGESDFFAQSIQAGLKIGF